MIDERPRKLSTMALLVMWGSELLTLGEKVLFYRDWSLDRGGEDGCYASPDAISRGLGRSLTPGSIETMRQRLKRAGLHYPIVRPEGKNLGWVSTLPADCIPRALREVPTLCLRLDRYLAAQDAWKAEAKDRGGRTHVQGKVEAPFHYQQNQRSTASRTPVPEVGGRGASPTPFSELSETQLPSQHSSHGEGSVQDAREEQKREDAEARRRSEEAFQHVKDVLRARRKAG